MAEAVGHDVDEPASGRQCSRKERIHRIARRRREDALGRRQMRSPVPSVLHGLEQIAMSAFVAGETVNRAGEVRKRFKVSASLEMRSVAAAGRTA